MSLKQDGIYSAVNRWQRPFIPMLLGGRDTGRLVHSYNCCGMMNIFTVLD